MISVSCDQRSLKGTVLLPSSKSESNRALIIQALGGSGIDLQNLSSARDTQTMIRLLQSEGHVLDVIDAGTTMRFLAAYFAVTGRDQILTGTPRMCQRPIHILVEALRDLGAEIEYWNQEGFPPLHLISSGKRMAGGEVRMAGNVSSQFISAILLISPYLEGGLTLHLEGEVHSVDYIKMTLKLMAHFGVKSSWKEQTITVAQQKYQPGTYAMESDWSAASYWYSMAALADEAEILLLGLRPKSWQGDQSIVSWMKPFGVTTTFVPEGALLTKTEAPARKKALSFDFTHSPDLAQTLAVVSAATGVPLKMSGLQSLRIKETDRIAALSNELAKFGVAMTPQKDPNSFTIEGEFQAVNATIETYEDHRMAMAFAPLALRAPGLTFKDESVVVKSYPEFWKHCEKIGFKVNYW